MMLSAFIGLRYSGFGFSGSASGNRFLSFISLASLIGMVLGVIALIVVVSVMNGFDAELKRRILGVVPHVVIDTPDIDLTGEPGVIASVVFLQRNALVLDGKASHLLTLNGIEAKQEGRISIIPKHMIHGSLDELAARPNGLVLGRPLAYRLGLLVGDQVTVVIPEPSVDGQTISPKIARLVLVGTFELDAELDYRLGLVNVDHLSAIVGNVPVQTRLRLNDVFDAARVSAETSRRYGVSTTNWTTQYGDFFETVKMEKVMMFVLLSLIVAIAAFNIVSSLSMMVKDKRGDIAVLRTFGLSSRRIMAIFVTQGVVIGVLGIVVGTVFGLAIAHNVTGLVAYLEGLFGGKMLAGTYFDSVPSDVRYADVALITLVAFIISVLATLYPAWRAASLQPVEVLRHE